jgi:outer membrane protein assembly factor BamD (BamD/ComL family)
MAEREETGRPMGLNRSRLAAAAMVVGGGLLAVAATAWTVVRFAELSEVRQAARSDFVAAAGLLLVGWGLGLLLWGVAETLRRLEDLHETLRAASGPARRMGDWTGPSADAHPEPQARLLEELVYLTRELRDIELLSEPERAARLRAEARELVGQLQHEIPTLLREHNLQAAQQRLQRARQRFPTLPEWDALTQQVEQARAKLEAHDLAAATREVDDLLALGAWDRAVEVVRNLRQRHPASEKVGELVRRVTVAREKATAEERARLMAQAQEATNRRDWRQALRRVETVLARFPGSPEAHDLRGQLPTLRANTEIQARHEMENTIRELIKEQQFAEALRLSNELIERYPDSPQAAVLRDQLPRLERKAAEVS